MKGRGKGKGQPPPITSSSSSSNSSDSSSDDEQQTTRSDNLQSGLSILTQVLHTPRFNNILERQSGEGVTLDDLDPLQLELESLLVNVVQRKLWLQRQYELLGTAAGDGTNSGGDSAALHAPTNKPSSSSSSAVSRAGGEKRGRVEASKSSTKKMRVETSSTKGKKIRPKQASRSSDTASVSATGSVGPASVESVTTAVRVNDAPNRFWSSVEPYCTDITEEHIKLCEELCSTSNRELEDYFQVPPLGRHYTLRWAQEDMEAETIANAVSGVTAEHLMRKAVSSPSTNGQSVVSGTTPGTNGNNAPPATNGELGALTQRLVSCLLEENMLNHDGGDSLLSSCSGSGGSGSNGTTTNGANSGLVLRSLSALGDAKTLEKRIRKELTEAGVLDDADLQDLCCDPDPDDEIFLELRKCQMQLRHVTEENQRTVERLMRACRDKIRHQEVQRKLNVLDSEVMDFYRKSVSTRQRTKRVPYSKKEREYISRILEERKALTSTLDKLQPLITAGGETSSLADSNAQ